MIRTRVSGNKSPADWMPTAKPTELSRIKLKKPWTQQPVPMMSEHSVHWTSLPESVHPWLWQYTYLLFDFDSALGQGSDFELKVDKLFSSAECRIRTLEVWDTKSPAAEKKNLNSTASPMMSEHSAHFTSLPDLVHPWLWRNRYLHNYMHTYIRVCCFEFRRSSTDKRFSNRKETSSLHLLNQGFQAGKSETSKSPADWMHTHKWSYRGIS